MAGGPLTEILVGTEDGLLRLSDGAVLLEGRVTAMAADGDELWALTDGSALWRGQGGDWHQVAGSPDLRGTCVLPAPDGAFVGTAEAHLVRVRDGRAERVDPFDTAPGRDAWYTPWGGPPDTRSLSADADGSIYANVHVGGILRSDDGDAWTPTIDIDADVHQVLAHPERPGVVLAACAIGLARSDDRGETWQVTRDGLHGTYLRAVAVAGGTILVTASTGPFSRQAAVYRMDADGTSPFQRCTDGLPEWLPSNIDTYCLTAVGNAAAFGTPDGRVFRSLDGGGTWEETAVGIPPVTAVTIRPR